MGHHQNGHAPSPTTTAATYHSFNDQIELSEPASPPRPRRSDSGTSTPRSVSSSRRSHTSTTQGHNHHQAFGKGNGSSRPSTAVKMQRQDSGYESHGTTAASPRTSISGHRPSISRRLSGHSVARVSMSIHNPSAPAGIHNLSSASSSRQASRPSTRRSTQSYSHAPQLVRSPLPQPSLSTHNLRPSSTIPTDASPTSSTYFQFPSPDSITDHEGSNSTHPVEQKRFSSATPSPPQTTHYWTSDRTRRLEYAAIDAASRGVKGWIKRNLVPECFLSEEGKRHISFEDDGGSVRRYRLDLEEDDEMDGGGQLVKGRRKVWPFSS